MSRTTLRPGFAALTVVVGLVLAVMLPAAADAVAYRYWGYFQQSGDNWKFAPKGPDQTKPADGSVEGWRYAIGEEGSTRDPRVSVTFDEICGDTEAKTGEKRVAVVIDYGRTADTEDGKEPPAPVGECAQVNTAATGAEVLADVADVRSEGALVCAIDQHPTTGCGGEVKTVSAAAKAPDTPVELKAEKSSASADPASDDQSRTGTWIGIGVAVLAAVALGVTALLRRRTA